MRNHKGRFKLAIFDLDGTLIEFHWDYLFSETHRVLRELGFPDVDREVLNDWFAKFDYFGFMPAEKKESFIEAFWERFDWNNFPKPVPLPGARETLAKLVENGVEVAIVTSRHIPVPQLREELHSTGFLDSVLHLITREDETVHWSDKRENLRLMCLHAGYAPEQTVMVGDIPADIESAREAGIGCTVAVTSGGIYRGVLEKSAPDVILDDVTGLVDLLL